MLWFQTDAFAAAVARARQLDAAILQAPCVNPRAQQLELWLRDRDGYVVVLSGPPGETAISNLDE